jgi:hypothetical protein
MRNRPLLKILRELCLTPRTYLGTSAFGVIWETMQSDIMSDLTKAAAQDIYFSYLRQEIVPLTRREEERIENLMKEAKLPLQ